MEPYILLVRPRLDPATEPVAKLLIEHRETLVHGDGGTVLKAHLSVRYRIIGEVPYGHRKQTYKFPACYVRDCGKDGRVCLTGSEPFRGAVYLEPDSLLGNRIGSFLMNEIIKWATTWPHADVNPIKLYAHQGNGENKPRRNRFYEQFGIRFDYTDRSHAEGLGREMQAGSLTPWANLPDNLSVMTLEEFLDQQERTLVAAQRDLKAQRRRSQNLDAALGRARDHPIRFSGGVIWETHGSIIVWLVLLLTASMVWYRS
ncbi:hypothetical protein [Acetobacter fallax]|uniref:N-acetyltransferase domain-containing protein n=1 Tax=Acetobacter fallax TaxID=1737473 RepID=A0ABX0KBK0_9PROT|nr:hypothetical protein [Acetobacter fallax]NHO33817.1 hypothetical protein [Acetobacter fallax]NHO37378.1 hypothetical protein [Acetobacter fallax]